MSDQGLSSVFAFLLRYETLGAALIAHYFYYAYRNGPWSLENLYFGGTLGRGCFALTFLWVPHRWQEFTSFGLFEKVVYYFPTLITSLVLITYAVGALFILADIERRHRASAAWLSRLWMLLIFNGLGLFSYGFFRAVASGKVVLLKVG